MAGGRLGPARVCPPRRLDPPFWFWFSIYFGEPSRYHRPCKDSRTHTLSPLPNSHYLSFWLCLCISDIPPNDTRHLTTRHLHIYASPPALQVFSLSSHQTLFCFQLSSLSLSLSTHITNTKISNAVLLPFRLDVFSFFLLPPSYPMAFLCLSVCLLRSISPSLQTLAYLS